MNNQTHPKDTHPALSVSEYLWLQGKRQQLKTTELQLELIKARQNRQAGWIVLLILAVAVLSVAVIVLAIL